MAENVFPTKNNLINTKKSLSLAKVGYDLMDRKRNILVREVMELMDDAKEIQLEIGEKYNAAYSALQRAMIEMGDCDWAAQSIPVDDSVKISARSVMGVEIPTATSDDCELRLHYSFTNTCEYLDIAYERFNEVKRLTVKLAEVENSVCRLADAIKKTRKRTNALGNIMIPKFESTIKYISNALEEKEREEFSRLKVIKSSKEG
ncbi:MAG: V-type ATP synthase subunit D [Clostridiales bacterium]|nr:V-type ATP synthase subunit D [Clostridiales bacterium]MCD7827662.1 V-type ATP synthase subunit D [Clostridiales bacterium]